MATEKKPSQIEAEDSDLALLAAACSPALRAGGEPGFQSTEEPRRALRRAAMRYGAAVAVLTAEATASEVAEFGAFAADDLTQGIRATIIAARRRTVGLSRGMKTACECVLAAYEELLREQSVDLPPYPHQATRSVYSALRSAQTLALAVEDAAMGAILAEITNATLCIVESARRRSGADAYLRGAVAALARPKDWTSPARRTP